MTKFNWIRKLTGTAVLLGAVFCVSAYAETVPPAPTSGGTAGGNTSSATVQAGGSAATAEEAGTAAADTGAAATSPTEKVWLSAAVSGNDKVEITGTLDGAKTGEDNILYLFELQPYQDTINGMTTPVSQCSEDSIHFTLPLNEGSDQTKLYSKFIPAVWLNGSYQAVGSAAYVTNPETVAKSKLEYKMPATKKGLLVELGMLNDAFELGVKHVNVNFDFAQITAGGGIDYTYEGKKYSFSSSAMADYDKTISTLSGKSMVITAIVLNGWNDATPELIYPGVTKSSTAHYYGFNTSTREGFETTRALVSFLADRYSGENYAHGRVSNWIFGNEINDGKIWNYMGKMSLSQYAAEYARSFRVFYTAVKSASANAKIYFSIDQLWNNPDADNSQVYSGRALLDAVNADIRDGGNLNWQLAFHPYPYPMTEPEFWDDAVTQDADTGVISFANLHVITDYLQQDVMKAPNGDVRHVILSEEGFTAISATRGNVENIQAAAFAYAYYIADSNPYVDAMIISRQVDAPSEVNTSCAFGLWSCDMNVGDQIKAVSTRKIWTVFKDIDRKNSTLQTSEFAKSIIGISKWSDVIPNFRWRSLEK